MTGSRWRCRLRSSGCGSSLRWKGPVRPITFAWVARLSGPLDREALRRALDRVVARHEALRTTFTQVDGQPFQRIAAEEIGFALQRYDLRRHRDAAGELERLMAEEAVAPFDLEAGPLIRGRLIQLNVGEHALLVTMHHIISDGWSMGVLTRELGALYRAYSEGQADPLPALEIQYADYAAWQRRWIAGDVLQAQAEYWRRTLAGAPALLTLPTDRPRQPGKIMAALSIELELDEALTQGLKALGQRHGTTLFMTLLAGLGDAAVTSCRTGRGGHRDAGGQPHASRRWSR